MGKANSTTKETRAYRCADVDMLMTLLIILGYMSDKLAKIIAERPDITQTIIDDHKTEINNTLVSDLGLNPIGDLVAQTYVLIVIFKNAKKKLSFFKKQVDAQYAETKGKLNKILSDLGFNTYWKKAQKGDQLAMINLLYQFNDNMDSTKIAELTSDGIQLNLINTINGYVNSLQQENIKQESLKLAIQSITQNTIVKFNHIYHENIKLFKICRAIFVMNGDPVASNMFSFEHICENLHIEHNKKSGTNS